MFVVKRGVGSFREGGQQIEITVIAEVAHDPFTPVICFRLGVSAMILDMFPRYESTGCFVIV